MKGWPVAVHLPTIFTDLTLMKGWHLPKPSLGNFTSPGASDTAKDNLSSELLVTHGMKKNRSLADNYTIVICPGKLKTEWQN